MLLAQGCGVSLKGLLEQRGGLGVLVAAKQRDAAPVQAGGVSSILRQRGCLWPRQRDAQRQRSIKPQTSIPVAHWFGPKLVCALG